MLTFFNFLIFLLVFILLSPILIVVLTVAATAIVYIGYCLLCLADSLSAAIESAVGWIEAHFPS